MKNGGIVHSPTALSPSASKSSASCNDLRLWVAGEYQTVKELIAGPVMSDHAAKIMLDSLEAIAREVGRERFHQTIVKVIETCERRPAIATYRKLAGLNTRLGPQEEALARAWELCTLITTRFLITDHEGNVSVRSRVSQKDGEYFEEHPPHIPPSVYRAVQALGGWKALQESYPQWHAQRFGTFKELLALTPDETARLLAPKSTTMTTT